MTQLTPQGLQDFEQQKEETLEIINALLEDGSDPEALYSIEHHLSSTNLEALEKASLEAFQLGLDVYDVEEVELDDGESILSFDIIFDSLLDEELIDKQVMQLMLLAEKYHITYDGWGTYFEEEPFYSESESKSKSKSEDD